LKRIVWYTLVVLTTITFLVVLWQFRRPMVLFLLSLAVSAAFRPLIDYFVQRRLPRNIALILSYALVLGVVAGVIIIISEPLARDLALLSNRLAIGYEQIKARWPVSGTQFERSLAELLPPSEELYAGLAGERGVEMGRAVLGVTTDALDFGGNLGLILILSLYWSTDSVHFERLLLSLIPVEQRPRARSIWSSIEKGVGAYIRSELVQSFLAGILLWVGYRLMGLEYPVLLALLGSIVWLIPWFGALLAVIPALLAGLSGGVGLAVLASVYTIIVLIIQEWVIEPRIFWRQRYSSLILVIFILILTDSFGLVGLILAPLVSAAVQIVFKYILQPPMTDISARTKDLETPQEIGLLETRLIKMRSALESRTEPVSPEIGNLIERLERLIIDANRYYDRVPFHKQKT
jgi:predicted PurR-regulated permease PerM